MRRGLFAAIAAIGASRGEVFGIRTGTIRNDSALGKSTASATTAAAEMVAASEAMAEVKERFDADMSDLLRGGIVADDGKSGQGNAHSLTVEVVTADTESMNETQIRHGAQPMLGLSADNIQAAYRLRRGQNSRETIKARRRKLAQHLRAVQLEPDARPVESLHINGVLMTPVYHE